MNESDARDALLLRAYESARDTPDSVWSDADRAWATRAAHAVEGESSSDEAFIARRARLGAERIAQRERTAARVLSLLSWRPWLGQMLLPLAFMLGIASDLIGASQRIALLAPPLLGLLAWNLGVYLFGGVLIFLRSSGRDPQPLRPIGAMLIRLSHGVASQRVLARLGGPIKQFATSWTQVSAPLAQARAARILHACAALLAGGMMLSLYVRGLVLEYRVGWESTFLDAGMVHALLSLVLGPAARITGLPLPDLAGIQALRLPASDGASAASWIHLYAVTVLLFVIVPRSLMALWSGWQVRRLQASFPLPLD